MKKTQDEKIDLIT